MGGFKTPDFVERQKTAAKAKKAALEKFRAKATDPAFSERQTARMASAAHRTAAKRPARLKSALTRLNEER